MEVAWVSVGGWVVAWESLVVVVDWVMVWESEMLVVVVEPGRGGPRRSMPADSRGWRDSSSFWGVSCWFHVGGKTRCVEVEGTYSLRFTV